MRAVLYEAYGPPCVLKLKEIRKPKPMDNEMLVRIHAATVTSGDVRLRSSDFPALFWLPARLVFGLLKPKKRILGHEFAGTVEEVGKDITRFRVGDQVFGTTTMLKNGSYAEYICLPQEWKHGVVEFKPANLNFKEAAALPIGAMTAFYLLEKANVANAKSILVYGASGSVGSYAVQIANLHGLNVTAVCSGSNFTMVRSLGVNQLIDYTEKDFSQIDENYEIVFDAVGKTSKSKAKKVLSAGGRFVSVKMMTKETGDHLRKIKIWAEDQKLVPYIDTYFNLEEIVRAHEYVDLGHKRGNVVVNILDQ